MRLAVLAIAAMLGACTTTPHTVAIKPPAELTEPVEVPALHVEPDGRVLNGSLARWADELKAALEEANRRLRAVGAL